MADVAVREYLENNSTLLEDIRETLIQSNTRLESVVDILTVQSDTLAQQMRTDSLVRENEELRLTEQQREEDRLQQASARMESESTGPAAIGSLDTTARGGLLRGLITAGLLGILGTAAYRYFGLDDFKDELAGSEAYDEFKKSVGDKFDSLIFGEEGDGGLVGAIENNPVASAAAGAGLVAFLMGGAKFRTVPLAMATFMLGYLGLNAFFNPEANQDVADAIDQGIKDLEADFETEFFKIFKEKTGVEITGQGLVNAGTATSIFLGTRLAASLFGATGVKGKLIVPLAGAMAYFAFNYLGLDDFFEPDDEDELFDFLESETLSEYGALIASALAMGTVALTPLALAAGAASAGKAKAPKGNKALKPRLLGRSKGLLIASAATAIAAYTFNRLGLDDFFAGSEEDNEADVDALEQQTDEAFENLLDATAVAGATALALSAARTPITRRGYTFDRNTRQYRVAPGNPTGGRFASAAEAATHVFSKYPRISSLVRRVPVIGTAFTAGGAYFILADDNLSVSEKISMVGGLLGGLSISVITGAIGTLIFPGVGTFAGGLVGFVAGEYLVTKLLLWALGADEEEVKTDLRSAIEDVEAQQQEQLRRANEFYESQGGRLGEDSSRPLGSGTNLEPGDGKGVAVPFGEEMSSLDEISQRDFIYGGSQLPIAIPQTNLMGEGNEARTLAENYLGRAMSDTEYGALLRAVYAEASGETGGEFTSEKAMIMASILNRARDDYQDHPQGSVIGALFAKNQFQAVTGVPGNRQPSPMYMEGPSGASLEDIEAATTLLPGISREQKNFTAAATGAYGPGTNIGYRDNMISSGGTTIGGTVFNTAPAPIEEVSMIPSAPTIASLDNIDRPTVTPSAMSLANMSNQINVPVTTVVNNIDNSQMIAGRGSGAARTAAARNVRVDTSYTSAAMNRFA